MKLKYFVILVMSLASFAKADDGLGQRWTKIIDQLQASGINKVGDLDLNSFRKEVQQIKWKSIEGTPESVESGSRQSATYSRATKQVSVSAQLPESAMASINQLELHEAMGALGYRDHDYSLSTALNTLSEMGSSAQRDRLKKAYDGTVFKKENIRANDGGTSVSGGGDLTTLFIKHQALQYILSQGGASDQFLTQYPYVNFEPISNPSYTQVYLYYKYIINPYVGSRNENFSLYIPMSRWRNPALRAALIREVARKITEIFPARTNANTRTFRPEDCPASVTATYPATQDKYVASIQSMRASILKGCKQFFDGQTSIGAMAPPLMNEEEPQQAGNYYFDCKYTYGKSVIPYRPAVPQGNHAFMGTQIGLDENAYSAHGYIAVSREGKLEYIQLAVYGESGGSKKELSNFPITYSKDGNSGIVKGIFNGVNLSYECKKAVK